jgi:hypothetical protein
VLVPVGLVLVVVKEINSFLTQSKHVCAFYSSYFEVTAHATPWGLYSVFFEANTHLTPSSMLSYFLGILVLEFCVVMW